jgi:hypothetical protein
VLAHLVDEHVALLRQAAGIDREDAHVGIDAPRHVDDGHAIALKAGADGDAVGRERRERPLDDFLGLTIVVLDRQLAGFPVVKRDPTLGVNINCHVHSPFLVRFRC